MTRSHPTLTAIIITLIVIPCIIPGIVEGQTDMRVKPGGDHHGDTWVYITSSRPKDALGLYTTEESKVKILYNHIHVSIISLVPGLNYSVSIPNTIKVPGMGNERTLVKGTLDNHTKDKTVIVTERSLQWLRVTVGPEVYTYYMITIFHTSVTGEGENTDGDMFYIPGTEVQIQLTKVFQAGIFGAVLNLIGVYFVMKYRRDKGVIKQ